MPWNQGACQGPHTPWHEQLAQGVIYRTLLEEPEMKLVMPPLLALMVPIAESPTAGATTNRGWKCLTFARVMDLLTQSHRFVIVHHCITYYWLKSFLGYVILLLRTADFDLYTAIQRFASVIKHSAIIRGMLLMQTMNDSAFVTNFPIQSATMGGRPLFWGHVPPPGPSFTCTR